MSQPRSSRESTERCQNRRCPMPSWSPELITNQAVPPIGAHQTDLPRSIPAPWKVAEPDTHNSLSALTRLSAGQCRPEVLMSQVKVMTRMTERRCPCSGQFWKAPISNFTADSAMHGYGKSAEHFGLSFVSRLARTFRRYELGRLLSRCNDRMAGGVGARATFVAKGFT